jgi:hypothetical protein
MFWAAPNLVEKKNPQKISSLIVIVFMIYFFS